MIVLKQQQGFMLAEVVVAILIISVALLGISSMFVQTSRAVSDNGNTAIAVNYAQRQIEILKTQSPVWWSTHCSNVIAEIEWLDGASTTGDYAVTTTVIDFPVGTTNLARVNVTVGWVEPNVNGINQQRSIVFTSLLNQGI